MTTPRHSQTLWIVPVLFPLYLFCVPAVAQYSGGNGTADDPYQIATAADLILLGKSANGDNGHFILVNDIDLDPNLPGGQVFRQAVIPKFSGTFDGDGHTIFNLTISGGSSAGLFGELVADAYRQAYPIIRDLRIVGAHVSTEGRTVGMLAGSNNGTIVGCHTSGTISGWETVGGLVGMNDDRIEECSSSVAVSGETNVGGLAGVNFGDVVICLSTGAVSGGQYVGGLAGVNFESVIDAYSTGPVSGGTRGASVGGLVGINYGHVGNSRSSGDVTGSSEVGGLVGTTFGGIVVNCLSTGDVTADANAGGLVGDNCGNAINSASTGTVFADHGAGGLAGVSEEVIVGCSATGAVSGRHAIGGLVGGNAGLVHNCCSGAPVTGDTTVGGLVGVNLADVTHCYSAGPVTGGQEAGGLIGTGAGRVDGCFWDVGASGQTSSAGGTGLATTEMQGIRPYLDAHWSFVDEGQGRWGAWLMPENGGYPSLRWGPGCTSPQLSGEGSRDDPYRISSSIGLASVTCAPTASYRLTTSIDLSGITWRHAVIPVFAGTFDGHGHTITGLTISGRNHLGLFGVLVRGASVCDLGLADVNVAGTDYIAGLVAENIGTVERCFSRGSVSSDAEVFYENCVGGLVGRSKFGSVCNCYSAGTVSGTQDVAGLVAQAWYVRNCYSSCTVSGDRYIGGLTAEGNPASCIGSFWDAEVSGQKNSAGGKGLRTADMQRAQTYLDAGWDFLGEEANGEEDIWWIDEGQDYPRLWWELLHEEPNDSGTVQSTAPVYRLWSPDYQTYLYTIDETEKETCLQDITADWEDQGIAYYAYPNANEPNVAPVYRFHSELLQSYFYTANPAEKEHIIAAYSDVWTYKGAAFYVFVGPTEELPSDVSPVYRFWSALFGCHFYTIDEKERDAFINERSDTWTYEGIVWYAYKP